MSVPDSAPSLRKRPFDIGQVVRRIRREVAQYADAAMFDMSGARVLPTGRRRRSPVMLR